MVKKKVPIGEYAYSMTSFLESTREMILCINGNKLLDKYRTGLM